MVSWELTLEPTARSGKFGHDLIRRVRKGLDDGRVETAAVLTDELVANAVTHGGQPIRLSVNRDDHSVKVAVTDGGPGRPAIRPMAPMAESGRGLVIVEICPTSGESTSSPAGSASGSGRRRTIGPRGGGR